MPVPDLAGPTIHITPWVDPVIDTVGFDPRSTYVETFWLGILGPSTTWLLRRLVVGLERQPAGYDLAMEETAHALGLGSRGGRNSPLVRSLGRCCQFGAATVSADHALAVRRRLPPLTRGQVSRLSPELADAHREWMEADLATPAAEQQRNRARRLALSMLELGEDLDATERQLHRWRFHPALARQATLWARDQHAEAAAAVATHDLGGDAA